MQQQIEDRNGLALGASGIARGGNQQGKLVEGRRQHVSDRLDHLSRQQASLGRRVESSRNHGKTVLPVDLPPPRPA